MCMNYGVSVVRYGVFLQAEDGIRDLVRSRGLGDVYKRQRYTFTSKKKWEWLMAAFVLAPWILRLLQLK